MSGPVAPGPGWPHDVAPSSWFVALPVDPTVRATLRARLDPLREDRAEEVAWTRPAGWHVTLVHLGRVRGDDPTPPVDLDRLATAVAATAADTPLELARLVRLGTALTVAVAPAGSAADWLGDLQARVATAVDAGHDATHRFRPHVTLGRVRRRHDPAAVLADLRAGGVGADPVAWEPSTVALLGSFTGAGPATYRTHRAWPLPR